MKRFFIALRFLTVYPYGGAGEVATEDLVGSVTYYPVVGTLVGLVLFLFWRWAQGVWPVMLAATLTVALWELMSAGLHLDGLMDAFDGLGVRGDLTRRLTVMKDSRVGAFGAQVLVLYVLLKVFAVTALNQNALLLIFAPLVGRTVMVALMATCNYARASGGLGKIFVDQVGLRHLMLTLCLYLLLGIAILGWPFFYFTVSQAAIFYLLRYFFSLNFGGVTGDILGAACELHELTVLLLAPFLLP